MNRKGTTLIEVLISATIVSFLVLTIYLALNSAVSNIGESKQRVGAIAIANEKMEIIRNLDYEDVGVVNGIINGPMLPYEVVTRNNFDYRVHIDVRYVDDELDGTGLDDLINTDYKSVQVKVEWDHFDSIKKVEFVSTFVPNGIETDMGGGSLVLNTMTSGGEIVESVSINLDSIEDTPSVNYNTTTDNNGSLILQGVPSQNYRITLSKDGHENVRTYPNPPDSAFTPNNPDFYVNEGDLNSKNFFIDLGSDLTIKAVNALDQTDISGAEIQLEGGRLIGSSPDTYNLSDISDTDSVGEVNYNNISQGSYEILNYDSLDFSNYDFVASSEEKIFQLMAGESKEIELLFADETQPALFLTVIDSVSSEPLEGAVVGVVQEGVFDQSVSTDENGRAFFPLQEDPFIPMENIDYILEVRLNDYTNYSEVITINNLTQKEIELIPN